MTCQQRRTNFYQLFGFSQGIGSKQFTICYRLRRGDFGYTPILRKQDYCLPKPPSEPTLGLPALGLVTTEDKLSQTLEHVQDS